MPSTDDGGMEEEENGREGQVHAILEALSWRYNDFGPLNVLHWFDTEFSARQWCAIEEKLGSLYARVQGQRKLAQEREAAEEWEDAATRWEQ